jgi:cytochrome c
MRVIFGLLAGLSMVVSANHALAAGDAEAGKVVFKKCSICHSPEQGVNKVGPSLWGVVGRHSASIADFNYSDAMKAADKTWDPATLDTWITNPKAFVPGTKMLFVGLKDQTDRDNVIAYLETLK